MNKTHIAIQIVTIENDGIHLMIKAYINRKKALLIVDSGASKTVFDIDRIKRLTGKQAIRRNDKRSTGVGTDNIISHETTISSFRLGKLIITDYKTVLIDLSHVNKSYAILGLPTVDGVLGSDILYLYKGVIDYHKKILELKWLQRH